MPKCGQLQFFLKMLQEEITVKAPNSTKMYFSFLIV